jgi:hypothetical protein
MFFFLRIDTQKLQTEMACHQTKKIDSKKKIRKQITLTLTAQRFGLERPGTNARPLDGGALNLVGTRTPANGRAAAPSSAPAASCVPCGARAGETDRDETGGGRLPPAVPQCLHGSRFWLGNRERKKKGGSGCCWPRPAAAQEPLATWPAPPCLLL